MLAGKKLWTHYGGPCIQQNTNFQVETAAWDLVKHDYLKIIEGDNRISENNLNSLFCIFNRFCDPHKVC